MPYRSPILRVSKTTATLAGRGRLRSLPAFTLPPDTSRAPRLPAEAVRTAWPRTDVGRGDEPNDRLRGTAGTPPGWGAPPPGTLPPWDRSRSGGGGLSVIVGEVAWRSRGHIGRSNLRAPVGTSERRPVYCSGA